MSMANSRVCLALALEGIKKKIKAEDEFERLARQLLVAITGGNDARKLDAQASVLGPLN
jgi:hypothetical protein